MVRYYKSSKNGRLEDCLEDDKYAFFRDPHILDFYDGRTGPIVEVEHEDGLKRKVRAKGASVGPLG